MSDHSDCAALFGICECSECTASDEPQSDCGNHAAVAHLDELHMWVIRSPDAKALARHRTNMIAMGFTVGPVEISRGWKEDCLPKGMFNFSASIPKAALSDSDFAKLVEWDRMHEGGAK